jgi:hypothetical protein
MKQLIIIFLLLIPAAIIAQDRIIRKNKAVIECKVTEITSDEIKYRQPSISSDVIFSIERADVDQIEFENGNIFKIENPMDATSYYEHNRRKALKISFLEPFTGSTGIYYEHLVKPGRTYELGIGIIGLGFDVDDRNAAGLYLSGGYKFTRTPDYYIPRMRYAHLLKGSYIKPEISIGYYTSNEYSMGYNAITGFNTGVQKEKTFLLGLIVNMGKQWVFDDSFLLDVYWGLGYGFAGSDEGRYHFSFSGGEKEAPIAIKAGLKIGFLTGKRIK